MTFSRAINEGDFQLSEEGFPVYVTPTINGTDALLEPMFDLEPDTTYVLTYSVESDIDGDRLAGSITFQTESDAVLPGKVSNFEYVAPIDVNFNTTDITLRWDSEVGADEYHIYARDSLYNTSEVLVETVTHRDHWVYHETTIDLPSQFDQFQSDNVQTPFSGGMR